MNGQEEARESVSLPLLGIVSSVLLLNAGTNHAQSLNAGTDAEQTQKFSLTSN